LTSEECPNDLATKPQNGEREFLGEPHPDLKPLWIYNSDRIDFATSLKSTFVNDQILIRLLSPQLRFHRSPSQILDYSMNLASLPHHYFEMNLDCGVYGRVVIGLVLNSIIPSMGYWGDPSVACYGYRSDDHGSKIGKCGTFKEGDTVGCGVNHEGYLFFTRNKKIFPTKHKLSPNEYHPCVSFDPVDFYTSTVTMNMACSVPQPEKPKHFPWDPSIQSPLGHIRLQEPCKQDFRLLDLPADILNIILDYNIGFFILESCRAVYQLLSPFYSWIKIFDFIPNFYGFYVDRRNSLGAVNDSGVYSCGFELKRDGTWEALCFTGPDLSDPKNPTHFSKIHQGTWEAQSDFLFSHDYFINFKRPDETQLPRTVSYKKLLLMEVKTKSEAFDKLVTPVWKSCYKRKNQGHTGSDDY